MLICLAPSCFAREGRKGCGGGNILTIGDGSADGMEAEEGLFRLYRFHRLGRQDFYIFRFPLGIPNLSSGGNDDASKP